MQDTLKKYSKDTRSYLRDTFWRYFCIYLLFCVQGRPKEWSHYVWRLTSSKNVRTNLRDFLVGLHFKCFVLNTSVNSISNKIIIQVAPPGDKINNQVLARHLRFNFECPYLWNQFAQFLAQFNAVILWTCSLTSYIGRRTEEGDPRVVASSVAGNRRQGYLPGPGATPSPEWCSWMADILNMF